MKRSLFLFALLTMGTISTSWGMQTAKTAEVQATYKDIKQTLGILPSFLKNYPEESVSGAWLDFKGLQLNASSVLPGKYKELIGLAICAQIPCQHCIHFHTEAAKLNKANPLEIKEAIAIAAGSRRWSTFLSGVQIGDADFRGEVDKMLMFQTNNKNLQAMESEPSSEVVVIITPEDAYKDMKNHMGFVPNFFSQYPKSSIVGAWKDLKGLEFNPNSEIPGKYKELVGLAVSAQIPSEYMIYYHTQAAIMQGATKEELAETAAVAATVRTWSTVLDGQQTDEAKFRGEVGQIMKHLKTKMGKEVGRAN
jgi:AhpD family alkylhydroperoxidase